MQNNIPISEQVYKEYIENSLSFMFSLLDMELTSTSRGSFDRTWWCWKFSDFSAPRLQEGIHTLSWLLTSSFAPSEGRNNPQLLEQTEAALLFWKKLQHKDGSFDEAYPNERSLAATAFTGFYVGRGIERTFNLLSKHTLSQGLESIEKLAQWLSRNGESHGVLSNHLAAAAAALQIAGDLLGTDRFQTASKRYLDTIYAHQDKDEGWLQEYGGADPGYQTHGMFYLAEIWQRTNNAELFQCLKKAVEFVAWFVHPDGTIGGEYASRGTKFAFPAAFEMLSPSIPLAGPVANHLRCCLSQRKGITLAQMDIWNFFPLLNNYIYALESACSLINCPALPWQERSAQIIFPNAGLGVARNTERLLVCSPSLGGSIKLWDTTTSRLLYEDCGYAMKSTKGYAVSQTKAMWKINTDQDATLSFLVDAPFRSVPRIRFTPMLFLAFRSFTLTLGRFPSVARWLKAILVRTLILKKRESDACLQRKIDFRSNGELIIEDSLVGITGELFGLDKHVPLHMGSTRYKDFKDILDLRQEGSIPQVVGTKAYRKERVS